MKKIGVAALAVCFELVAPFALRAGDAAGPHSGFFLSGYYSSLGGPIFRAPSGSEEVAISGSSGKPGFMGGYELNWEKFGCAARVSYFQAGFANFVAPQMPGSPYPTYVKYDMPKLSFIFLDLIAQWFPMDGGFLGIYGLLGMGMGSESYTLSGSDFAEWNGAKSRTEFDYSYGIGLRIAPVRFLSIYGEVRFVPGDTSFDLDYLYSDATYDYFRVAGSSTPHTTTIFMAGLAVNF